MYPQGHTFRAVSGLPRGRRLEITVSILALTCGVLQFCIFVTGGFAAFTDYLSKIKNTLRTAARTRASSKLISANGE